MRTGEWVVQLEGAEYLGSIVQMESQHAGYQFSLHTYRITRTLTSYVMKNAFGPLVV